MRTGGGGGGGGGVGRGKARRKGDKLFRALDLKFVGPRVKYSTVLLGLVLAGCPEFNSSTSLCS